MINWIRKDLDMQMKQDHTRTPPSTRPSRRVLLLGGGALLLGAGGWWGLSRHRPTHEGRILTVAQAHVDAQTGEILLLDIRTPSEWRQTGIPAGAVPLDMRRADFQEALRALQVQDPGRPVALICAGGVRSARLTRQLLASGFEDIIDVPEGVYGSTAGPGWLSSNLPVRPWTG